MFRLFVPRKVKCGEKLYRLQFKSQSRFMDEGHERWSISWIAEDGTYLMEFVDNSFIRGCIRAAIWVRKDTGYGCKIVK